MSDNFYDFDKDDAFDESYLKKSSNTPHNHQKKEFEIEIPMPRQNAGSYVQNRQTSQPQHTQKTPQRKPASRRKKLSPVARILAVLGIIVSCFLVFAVSFAATIYMWVKWPDSEQAPSSGNTINVQENTEMIQIEDNGHAIVDDVPLYTGSGENSSSSSKSENDETSESDSDGDTGSDVVEIIDTDQD